MDKRLEIGLISLMETLAIFGQRHTKTLAGEAGAPTDASEETTAEELQARARESLEEINARALERARELGVAQDLFDFEGLTPQMIEALAEDGVKTLEDFATCADWELAGGYTTVDGKRVKDAGLLEKFDMSLAEARHLVMNARVQAGWISAEELAAEQAAEEAAAAEAAAEAAAASPAEESIESVFGTGSASER